MKISQSHLDGLMRDLPKYKLKTTLKLINPPLIQLKDLIPYIFQFNTILSLGS